MRKRRDAVIFMTGEQFRYIRHMLGLTLFQIGWALGKRGNDNTIRGLPLDYEEGRKLVGRTHADQMNEWAAMGHVPADLLPDAPPEGQEQGEASVTYVGGRSSPSHRSGMVAQPARRSPGIKVYDLTRE